MWVHGRLTKKQVTTRPGHFWPEEWSRMSNNAQRKAIKTWRQKKTQIWTRWETNEVFLLFWRRILVMTIMHEQCKKKMENQECLSDALQRHHTSRLERFKLEATLCKWLVQDGKRQDWIVRFRRKIMRTSWLNRKEFRTTKSKEETHKDHISDRCHVSMSHCATWCTNRIPYWPAAGVAMDKEWDKWRMKQSRVCDMMLNATSTSCWSNTE